MIRIILFLYSILSVTMGAEHSFIVTSDDQNYSLSTQNGATVAALMGGAPTFPPFTRTVEDELPYLRSTVAYLGRTVDGQYHTIQWQEHLISNQQRKIEWQEAEIVRLRWSLAQAHRDGPPPPPYSPPPHTSGRTDMEAPPPNHEEADSKDACTHNTATTELKRSACKFTPQLKMLETNLLYREFNNHTLIELLALQETDPRRKVMVEITIGRKIVAERQGKARAESITYFKEAQTLSALDEGLVDLWKFATVGLGLAYCDNRENLRGLLELYNLKAETAHFVTQPRRVGYFKTSLLEGWKERLKNTGWLIAMSQQEQEKIIQQIIEAANFYGLIQE